MTRAAFRVVAVLRVVLLALALAALRLGWPAAGDVLLGADARLRRASLQWLERERRKVADG